MSEKNEIASNRKARFNYEILETFEAGIVLQGTEIKSLRANGGSLQEAYIKIVGQQAYLLGCHIAPYRFGNIHNHEEKRDRKLLLHKRELKQLDEATSIKGQTIVPLSMFLKNGRVKLLIATAKGKKTHDKRQAIKERDEKKEIDKLKKMHK